MKVTDTHVYFWGGPLSNWYPCSFEAMLGGYYMEFNCSEQYLMAGKAYEFNDERALERIMRSSNPKDQKAIGRTVLGFDTVHWNKVAKEWNYQANWNKFFDPKLKKVLEDTGTRTLVEGSPYDQIWGVGLAWYDPRIENEANWKGTNWHGETLMEVRNNVL